MNYNDAEVTENGTCTNTCTYRVELDGPDLGLERSVEEISSGLRERNVEKISSGLREREEC